MLPSLAVLLVILFNCINGEVRVSGIFSNNMILQIPYPSNGVPATKIFGTAFLNETVHISGSIGFPGPFKLTPNCTNGKQCEYGNWSVNIIPNQSSSSFPGPYTISITSILNTDNSLTGNITFNNTYFGEVFLCSGQSNMEVKVYQCMNYQNELNYSKYLPNIRLYQTATLYSNNTLQNISSNSLGNKYGWVVAGSGIINDFSCICWESARILTQWLMSNNPTVKPYIGLIESDIGGTSVYFWASGIAGRACNLTHNLPNSGEAADLGPPYYNHPGSIYNAMINPLCMNGNGISIRQAIYYQGEADSGENDNYNQNAYICNLNGLIYSWRYCFNQTLLPFINIQLPNGMVFPYNNDDTCNKNGVNGYSGLNVGWQGIEVAQYEVYKMNDMTGIVTDEDQGQNTLHYSYKLQVSKRVELWSRYLVFNDKTLTKYHVLNGIDPSETDYNPYNPLPPTYINSYKKKGNDLTVYISIDNTGPNGLHLQNGVNCSTFNNQYGTATVCTSNCTEYKCCSMGGVNTIKFRMEGWYWYSKNGNGRYLGLLNWFPGNITSFINNGVNNKSIIIAQPVLPEIGGINWPSNGDSVLEYEAISVRQMEIGCSNACTISNSFDIPISKSGPHNIDLQE